MVSGMVVVVWHGIRVCARTLLQCHFNSISILYLKNLNILIIEQPFVKLDNKNIIDPRYFANRYLDFVLRTLIVLQIDLIPAVLDLLHLLLIDLDSVN